MPNSCEIEAVAPPRATPIDERAGLLQSRTGYGSLPTGGVAEGAARTEQRGVARLTPSMLAVCVSVLCIDAARGMFTPTLVHYMHALGGDKHSLALAAAIPSRMSSVSKHRPCEAAS